MSERKQYDLHVIVLGEIEPKDALLVAVFAENEFKQAGESALSMSTNVGDKYVSIKRTEADNHLIVVSERGAR